METLPEYRWFELGQWDMLLLPADLNVASQGLVDHFGLERSFRPNAHQSSPNALHFLAFLRGVPKIDIEIALKIDVSRAACACFKTWVFMNYPHINGGSSRGRKSGVLCQKKTSRNMSCWKENDHCFLLI